MSESGKVSLPEIDYTRLQSIRDKHLRMDKEIFWNELEVKPGSLHGDRACLLGIIDYYIAALDKAEKEKDKAIDLLGDNLDDKAALIHRYGKEITELRDRLYEANQDAETEQKLNDTLHSSNKELRKKLVEAQQTIAQQLEREQSIIYEVSEIHKEAAAGNSGSLDRADTALNRIMLLSSNLLALGNKEGSDKA